MNGRDFIRVAETLSAGNSEAEWRSAVSRAYYAAFHAARDFLANCGFSAPRADRAHTYAWLRLANSGHPETATAGNQLNNLRGQRNYADYDVRRPLSRADSGAQIENAWEIIRALDGVAANSNKTQLIEAIKTYEHDVLREETWRA